MVYTVIKFVTAYTQKIFIQSLFKVQNILHTEFVQSTIYIL